ncbi:MAG: aminotransferase class V-fold PLP-dependent enzyme [Ruminococcus sp.]|nr:aminotransferase class V-fold PLP-dependent enzyme [Ruminococcus sp.]
MLNFTVGPVQSSEIVRRIGSEHIPYFRTSEFSDVMLENERLMLEFADAEENGRTVFLTGSGTASMEAAVMNTLTTSDRVLVVNGGSFGQRFVELLTIHEITFTEIRLEFGEALTKQCLERYDGSAYTAFVINVGETSSGVLYDMDVISAYCREHHLFLIADTISAFLADAFSMKRYAVDVMITGSQKALACPPGVSVLVLSPRALDRIKRTNQRIMYLDLKSALRNQERGQTPFTPAVGVLLQINARLREIRDNGGATYEINRTAMLAKYFRDQIKDLPFKYVAQNMSNAVTSLHPTTVSAYDLFIELKEHYSIWVCPNGGQYKDSVFRVGHLGELRTEDYDTLIHAFHELKDRGFF